jgi:hypothetical protein
MASVDGLVEEEFAAAGRNDALTDAVGIRICMSHPEFIERLGAAESPAAVAGIVEELRAVVREAVDRHIEIEDFRAALQSPDSKPVDVFNAMKPIHTAINTAVNAMLAGKEEVGPDDRAGAAQILVEMIAGSRPGLAQRFEANTLAGVPPEKRDLIYDVFDALDPLARTQRETQTAKPVGSGPCSSPASSGTPTRWRNCAPKGSSTARTSCRSSTATLASRRQPTTGRSTTP